ncbi:MAG TPA: BatA domain-containing protein [Gemmatimonadaceae bacterium]
MIWLNPLAFAGLLAVAVPILVHLFGRPRARRQPFPSLRFIALSRQAPIRRSRPSDWLLLVLRVAVIVVAVAALARPHWPAAGATEGRDLVSRVVVVDTSRSMMRLTSAGDRGLDAALREADRLVAVSDAGLVVRTSDPGTAVAGAGEWLAQRGGRREVVILSDFQGDALSKTRLATVPQDVGVSLVRVAVIGSPDPIERLVHKGPYSLATQVTVTGQSNGVRWSARPTDAGGDDSTIIVLSGETEREAAAAALEAARGRGAFADRSPGRAYLPIVVATPGFTGRDAMLRAARRATQPWQGSVLLRLRADDVMREAARRASPDTSTPINRAQLTPVARSAGGSVVAFAAESSLEGRNVLVLFPMVDAGSVASAALVGAAIAAAGIAPVFAEEDPTVLPDEALRLLERPSSSVRPAAGGANPGRWLWAVAVALLGLESMLRRTRRAHPAISVRGNHARERVA